MPDYTVRPGDTLRSIANMFNIPLVNIIAFNPGITDPTNIIVGQVIRIPEGYSRRIINVNGFANPNISRSRLSDALPYLTFLSIFSYNVQPDGTLATINDTDLIELSRRAGTGPLMVISNVDENGEISAELAHQILANEMLQITLLKNIVKVMKEKNYYGLNIIFNNIYPSDRGALTEFFNLAALNIFPLGSIVVASDLIAIDPNSSMLLYDTIDFNTYTEYVNQLFIIIAYATRSALLPPMAIAPLNEMKRVLDYSVSIIPSQSILLGMTNYALDWTLPYHPARPAKKLTYSQALELSRQKSSYIWFDPISQSANFFYTDPANTQHVVWLYNELSIRRRLELVGEYNLGGISFSMIDDFSLDTYLALHSMYEIRKI